MTFKNLTPLKRWVIENKYFIKTSEPKERKIEATHCLLDGGIWKIPKSEYITFLKMLADDLTNGHKHYISENRGEVFRFICDLDFFELDEQISVSAVEQVVSVIQQIIKEYYSVEYSVIICGSDTKTVIRNDKEYIKSGFHLIWPKLYVNVDIAKQLRILFIELLIDTFGERESDNLWSDVVDLAIYEDNGLRMVGCRKMGICKTCKNKKDIKTTCTVCEGTGRKEDPRFYSPKSVLPNDSSDYLHKLQIDYYLLLLDTCIYNYNNNELSNLTKRMELPLPEQNSQGSSSKKENGTNGRKSKTSSPDSEIEVKVENFIRKYFKDTHPTIRVRKVTKKESDNINVYFAEVDDNFCINVNREHNSSSIYFQIKPSGVCQRCYCKKDTTDGRIAGPCKTFQSTEVPLTAYFKKFLFGSTRSKTKKIANIAISRTSSIASLDMAIPKQHSTKSSLKRETCLDHCRVILDSLERELTKGQN